MVKNKTYLCWRSQFMGAKSSRTRVVGYVFYSTQPEKYKIFERVILLFGRSSYQDVWYVRGRNVYCKIEPRTDPCLFVDAFTNHLLNYLYLMPWVAEFIWKNMKNQVRWIAQMKERTANHWNSTNSSSHLLYPSQQKEHCKSGKPSHAKLEEYWYKS